MSVTETMDAFAPSIENFPVAKNDIVADSKTVTEQPSLRNTVTHTMEKYFVSMAGHPIADVYTMVLAQVETPLLTSMMRFCRGNQSRAAILLGLSRGTLRKKLKLYDLETIHLTEPKLKLETEGTFPALTDVVESNVTTYLMKMKNQPIADVYEMVLAEIEEPLLLSMMKHTRGNQSRAAILFGLSRGTLRKKLKTYGLD